MYDQPKKLWIDFGLWRDLYGFQGFTPFFPHPGHESLPLSNTWFFMRKQESSGIVYFLPRSMQRRSVNSRHLAHTKRMDIKMSELKSLTPSRQHHLLPKCDQLKSKASTFRWETETYRNQTKHIEMYSINDGKCVQLTDGYLIRILWKRCSSFTTVSSYNLATATILQGLNRLTCRSPGTFSPWSNNSSFWNGLESTATHSAISTHKLIYIS